MLSGVGEPMQRLPFRPWTIAKYLRRDLFCLEVLIEHVHHSNRQGRHLKTYWEETKAGAVFFTGREKIASADKDGTIRIWDVESRAIETANDNVLTTMC